MSEIKNRGISLSRLLLAILAAASPRLVAAEAPAAAERMPRPLYQITVVGRTIPTVNYETHRGLPTKIDFAGTSLLPGARGEAEVENKKGYSTVEVEFDGLLPATRFGPEYLTYVLWAITPEGRATNLGEVVRRGERDRESKLNVTTELQAFGLLVTAEPYFAVTRPSNVVVLENRIRKDTSGKVDAVEAKYELLERGEYTAHVSAAEVTALTTDSHDLDQARNALRIARFAGADRYATDTWQRARQLLERAETESRHGDRKDVVTSAREAVQTAEDARMIAVKRAAEEQRESERAAAAAREASAKAATQAEAELRQQAEQGRAVAEADAEAARKAAEDSERARLQAEQEKAELRAQLIARLNVILETRETARGLVMSLPGVYFDSGSAGLRPVAREKLARVAGVVIATPDLRLSVEGHTDSQGGEEFNQSLSERRAMSVRDYLVEQGIAADTVTARGFGESQPVASNDSAAGRQQNRRVELVVTGQILEVAVSR